MWLADLSKSEQSLTTSHVVTFFQNDDKTSPVGAKAIAVRDLPWKDFLHGEHRNEILEAHKKEFDGLTGTIVKEIFPGDAEYQAAQRRTNCRLILEFKRVGVWKVRCVIQGFREDCVALDSEDFKYNSDVAGLMVIRNVVFNPIRRNIDGMLEDVMLSSIDIAYAYLQSDLFPTSCLPRYLKVKDPVTGTYRVFQQYGVLYRYQDRQWSAGNKRSVHGWCRKVLCGEPTSHAPSTTRSRKSRWAVKRQRCRLWPGLRAMTAGLQLSCQLKGLCRPATCWRVTCTPTCLPLQLRSTPAASVLAKACGCPMSVASSGSVSPRWCALVATTQQQWHTPNSTVKCSKI